MGYSYIRQILYWNFFRSTTQLTYLDFRYLSLCNIPPIQASRLLLHWSRLLCQRSGNCVLRQYIIVHIFSFDGFRLSVYDSHHSRSCSIKLSHLYRNSLFIYSQHGDKPICTELFVFISKLLILGKAQAPFNRGFIIDISPYLLNALAIAFCRLKSLDFISRILNISKTLILPYYGRSWFLENPLFTRGLVTFDKIIRQFLCINTKFVLV